MNIGFQRFHRYPFLSGIATPRAKSVAIIESYEQRRKRWKTSPLSKKNNQ